MVYDALFVLLHPIYEAFADLMNLGRCRLELKAEMEEVDKLNEVVIVPLMCEAFTEKNWCNVQCP